MIPLRRLLLAASVFVASPCAADTKVQHNGMATLEVHFQPSLTLADTIMVTLTIDASPAHEINVPRDLPANSKWLLVKRSKEERETIKPGLIRWRQTYRFAPKEPGAAPFPFPVVKLRESDTAVQTIAWEPIEFTVAMPTIAPERAKMRDGAAIEKSSEPAVGPSEYLPAILFASIAGALILLVVVAVLMRRWCRRKRPASALDRALYEWRRLLAMNLPRQERSERFITLLTMLVREYVERELDWPARRQTTREFIERCTCLPAPVGRAGVSLNDAEKRFLADLFERAEVVKFAHAPMTADECADWAERVRQFLEARRPFPVAKPGQAQEEVPVEKFGQTG